MTQDDNPLTYKPAREYALIEQVMRADRINLPMAVMLIASMLGITLGLFHIYVAGFGSPESHSFRSTHLSIMLVLAIMVWPICRSSISEPLTGANRGETARRQIGFAIDLTLIALIVFVQFYILSDVEELQAREGDLLPMDVVVGIILVALVLEATRRAVGWTMVIITGFFILYFEW